MVKEHARKDIPLSLLKAIQKFFICIGLWLGRILLNKSIYLLFELGINLKVERELSLVVLFHINTISNFSQLL